MNVLRHCPDGCAGITAARLTLLDGQLAFAKAEKQAIVEMLRREREEHRQQLQGAVEALRTIALFNAREGTATGLPSAEAKIAREWLEAAGLTISGGQ